MHVTEMEHHADFAVPVTQRLWIETMIPRKTGAGVIAGRAIALGWWVGTDIARSLIFLLIPFMAWAGLRFDQRTVTATIVAVTGVAVLATINNRSPFQFFTRNEALLTLQAFITTVALPAWTMLLYWMAIQLLGGFASVVQGGEGGGVAFWAHVGGFVAGVVLVKLFARPDHLVAHRSHHWQPRRQGW